MNSSNHSSDNSDLERIAGINPHAKRSIDHDGLLERGLGHSGDNLHLRARFNLGRAGWAGLTGAVAAALVLATALMPGGGKSHNFYLFSSQGGAMNSKSDVRFGTNYTGVLTAGGMTPAMSVMMPAWKANYTAGNSLSDQAGSGHIYQLASLASNKILAQRLADFVGIDSLGLSSDSNNYEYYSSQATADGTPRPNGYSDPNAGKSIQDQPLSTDRYASVNGQVGQASGFNFNDNAAYGWQICNQGMTPVPNYCADLKKQQLPSLTTATDYAASALEAMGMRTGTTLADTPNGGYLLSASPTSGSSMVVAYSVAQGSATAADSNTTSSDQSGVTVTGNLVVDGQLTSVTSYFYWYEGSSKVASFGGTLAKVVDRGSFDTISAKVTVTRLNQSYFQGSAYLAPDTKWSDSSFSGIGSQSSNLAKQVWACMYSGPGATSGSIGKPEVSQSDSSGSGSGSSSSGSVESTPVPPIEASAAPGGPGATTEPAPAPTSTDLPTPVPNPSCELDMTGGVPNVDITVTKAKTTLVQLSDNNGGTWLVPGFNFYDETGYLASAYSVVDGVIDITPPSVEPMTK